MSLEELYDIWYAGVLFTGGMVTGMVLLSVVLFIFGWK